MFTSLRTTARSAVAAGHRVTECRRHGHAWTDRADPPACTRCGRSQPSADEPSAA